MLNEQQLFDLLLKGKSGTNGSKLLLHKDHFDDGAILDVHERIAVSTDFIRGPHFNLAEAGWLDFNDLAHYLVAANVSDVSAMGAIPQFFLDIFRYPQDTPEEIQTSFFYGLSKALAHYKTELVGGDSGTYTDFVLSGTCIGKMQPGCKPLLRSKLKPGDLLCFAGSVGGARAAQVALLDKSIQPQLSEQETNELLASWKRPNVPFELGPYLSKTRMSECAQDTSDGLGATIDSICKMSDTGAIIWADSLPISNCLRRVADLSRRDLYELALSTSPDFGLLFSVSKQQESSVEEELKQWGCTIIGEATKEPKDRILRSSSGDTELPDEKWRQGQFKV